MDLSPGALLKLMSFLGWCYAYLWLSATPPRRSPEWCSRAVTLLHGTVATVVGLAQCNVFALESCSFTMQLLPRHYALMLWSWGYFAFDLLWCLIYWTDNILMLGHHVSALAAITLYMKKDYTGCAFPCTLAFMEVTNPLLQLRWFLKTEGYGRSIVYLIVEVTYLLLFLIIRGGLGTYAIYKILDSDIFDNESKIISLVFYVVSVAFIYDILGYVLYKYKNKIDEFQGFLEEMGLILNSQT